MLHHSMVVDTEELNTVSLHQTNTQILLNTNSHTVLLPTANQLHRGTLMPTTRAATPTNTSNTNDLNHYQHLHHNNVTVQPV